MNGHVLQPHSDWMMPEKFPDLSSASRISIDVETCDPNLKTKGPGWVFEDGGFLAGVAVATPEHGAFYFPTGHAVGPKFAKEAVRDWLRKELSRSEQPKIIFNAIYDLGWLQWLGVQVKGEVRDPMLAAAILDEYRKFYNLDALSKDWLGEQKNEDLLRTAALSFGLKDVKGEMWKLPAIYVGPYAEQDALLNIRLDDYTTKRLADEDLLKIYALECKQLPVLLAMRTRGVRVDVSAAERLGDELEKKEAEALKQVEKLTGVEVDIWSNNSLAEVYGKMGIAFKRTDKGNPSFTQEWLKSQPDQVSAYIVQSRVANRARSTFSSGLILDFASKHGRIHCQFNQLKGDDYGTVSGRYSSSTPNLQQIPSRDPEIGPLVRSLFLPEPGCLWAKHDYSQQEPRLTVHYAHQLELPGSNAAVEYYKTDPDPDYHQLVANMAGIERKPAKTINLGLAYGMGQGKLAASLGLSPEAAKELFGIYHQRVPFVKSLSNAAGNRAADVGYIRTILGRRCRFNKWEPADFDFSKKTSALEDRDQMILVVEREIKTAREEKRKAPKPGVRRAFTYRAMNRLIQGSAADMTKKALVDVFAEGIVPMLQVHDELDTSVESEAQARKIQQVMIEAVPLAVPIKVDVEVGPNWGSVKKNYDWTAVLGKV